MVVLLYFAGEDESEMDLENGSSGLYFYEMPGLPELEEEENGTKKTRVKFSTASIVVWHLWNFTHRLF